VPKVTNDLFALSGPARPWPNSTSIGIGTTHERTPCTIRRDGNPTPWATTTSMISSQ